MFDTIDSHETVAPVAPSARLDGKRIRFVGKLGGVTRREAAGLIRQHGGIPARQDDGNVDIVVIGAEELPLNYARLISPATRQAAAEHRLEIINETELWQRLGLVEQETHIRQLCTPAMLADLVGVPVSIIRRWHRSGLIVPVRELHRLPYFDFQEVATARQLAQLLAAGASPTAIERELAQLSRYVPDVERPLAQLAVIIEGKQLLLRQGEGLIEPGGQRRFDFEPLDDTRSPDTDGTTSAKRTGRGDAERHCDEETQPICAISASRAGPSLEQLLQMASDLEDAGQLEQAIDLYRTVLGVAGPTAEWNFRLAELLYRKGDVTAARERYYITVELDEDYVEARANLGCVLAELGQIELAIAAFEGALSRHHDYPDVHFHLARALDDAGRPVDADDHWRAFLALAPASPWASEARERLGILL